MRVVEDYPETLATTQVRRFIEQYDAGRSPGAKMIAIDQLLHTFHHQLTEHPTAPAAKNLLFGNVREIVGFLNGLTYGKATTPELRQTKSVYDETLARSWAGGVTPQQWRRRWHKAKNSGA